MKKSYFKLLLGAMSLLSFSAAKAQTYTAGDITAAVMPMMSHDSSTCSSTCNVMYSITINSSFMGDSVRLVDTNSASLIYSAYNTTGANPWTFTVPVPMYMSNVTDDQIPVGGGMAMFFGPVIKIVSGTDTIHGIPNMYNLMVTNPCLYGNVSGMVYIDNNGDCMFNTGDVALNSLPITSVAALTSSTGSITSSGYTGATGLYNMTVQKSWMTHYSVDLPSAYHFIFPYTSCFSGAYSYTTLPQINVDFPLQCTNNVDVECWAGSPASVRLHTPFYMQPTVNNTGCDSISGVLTFIKDSRVTYDASLSTMPAMSVSGDTLRWNYTNLTNLSNSAYWNNFLTNIHLTPDASVAVGDNLCFRVYTGVPSTDLNPANNDYTICLPVVYSYDPNLKEVSPKGSGAAGNIPASTPTLTYTLHFQNTGTAAAYNISIIDTLDGDVTASSLKIISTSHTMTPEWLAPNVVKFNFNSIFLPDSTTNEAASHGYVRFSVNMHSGLPLGTQIKNKGYIYFDANPPVITNTALNTIANTTEVGHILPATDVKVYPNPASTTINVENLQNGKITILNMNGSVVLDQQISSNKATVDISALPNGVYIMKTIGDNNTTTRKFVKQ